MRSMKLLKLLPTQDQNDIQINIDKPTPTHKIFPKHLEQISTRLVCNKFQDLERTVIQDLKQILQDNQKGQHVQTTLVFASPNDKSRNQSIEGKASVTSNSSNGSQSRLMFARQDKLTSGSFNFATPSKRTPSSYQEVNRNGKGMIPQKRKQVTSCNQQFNLDMKKQVIVMISEVTQDNSKTKLQREKSLTMECQHHKNLSDFLMMQCQQILLPLVFDLLPPS
eukprot:403350310